VQQDADWSQELGVAEEDGEHAQDLYTRPRLQRRVAPQYQDCQDHGKEIEEEEPAVGEGEG
jgi:hypothetical protein